MTANKNAACTVFRLYRTPSPQTGREHASTRAREHASTRAQKSSYLFSLDPFFGVLDIKYIEQIH